MLEGGRRTAAKSGLYPMGYSGIGLYTPADQITHSADFIYYLSKDDRLYNNGDGPPFSIEHIPGHKQYGDKINSGEAKPFPISHLPGKVIPPKDTPLPGKIVPFTQWVKLVTHPKIVAPKTTGFKEWFNISATSLY